MGTVTPQQDHPRQRMIQSALVLMGQQGIEATSFSQVLEHSGAPRGSIYHHFPGGKAQLIEEVTHYAGDVVEALCLQAVEEHADPVAAVEAIGNFWRTVLYDSDFAAGCPVVAATLTGDYSPAAKAAANSAAICSSRKSTMTWPAFSPEICIGSVELCPTRPRHAQSGDFRGVRWRS